VERLLTLGEHLALRRAVGWEPLPEHQGRGIGGRLMEAALALPKGHCSAGALVGLTSAQGAASFYARYGPSEAPGIYLTQPPGAGSG
jgi:predicted N-acetyltransferase YhbS